jgi:hypothetical protein
MSSSDFDFIVGVFLTADQLLDASTRHSTDLTSSAHRLQSCRPLSISSIFFFLPTNYIRHFFMHYESTMNVARAILEMRAVLP